MADSFNTPNVVVPLAMSYDTRYVNSRAAMQAGTDQRKVNCFYDVINNPVTGKTTLELVKRPGIVRSSLGSSVGSTPVQYNITENGSNSTYVWWSTRNSVNENYVSDYTTDTVVLTNASYVPYIISATTVSNTVTMVSQYRSSTFNSAQKVFYASAIGSWTEITDSVFTGLYHRGKMEFIDGFALIMDSTGGIYNSAINSLSSWPAINFIKRSTYFDEAQGLARFGPQILAFGAGTVEVFLNAGNPSGSPLSRVQSLSASVGMGQIAQVSTAGLGRTNYYAILGQKMYFVGRYGGGRGDQALFAYNGQSFEKIGSGVLGRVLSEIAVGNTEPLIYSVNKVLFKGHEAVAIQLTPPGTTAQKWLMFFPSLNEWFEWESSVFSPVNAGGYFLAGGSTLGTKTFSFADNTGTATTANDWRDDYGNTNVAITATVQFKVPKQGNNRDFMRWCALDADTTTSASNVTVKFSDDDYQNFDAGRTIDLNTAEKRLMRCGSFKNRIVRLEHSANAEFRARKFLARIE